MDMKVTVFSDYICPFCYVGDARLDRLRDDYDFDVDWCFFEIHPDNPPQGRPVEELGYDPLTWSRMMENLERMAAAEGLPLAERRFTTNSHRAMLLAEATKEVAPESFEGLHKALFQGYFRDQQNIGDASVLREIAADCGISEAIVEQAWSDPRFAERLYDQQRRAATNGITGVPAFIVGRYLVQGAVPVETLRTAFSRALSEQQGADYD